MDLNNMPKRTAGDLTTIVRAQKLIMLEKQQNKADLKTGASEKPAKGLEDVSSSAWGKPE